LPIIIENHGGGFWRADGVDNDFDNIVAALGHLDRVRSIDLRIPDTELNRFATAMKEPFPELTSFGLRTTNEEPVLSLPDSFLGGSAPRLQTLWLIGISFPAIGKLLSSASNLVTLRLIDIPHSGYISPEAMAIGLSPLTRLNHLSIWLQSPLSQPAQPSQPWSVRVVLPSLNHFAFRGVSEYLEDLTCHIDAPLLSNLYITFFNQLIFKTPYLSSFISHAENLRSQSQARMIFYRDSVQLFHTTAGRPGLHLEILCEASDWQLSALAQVCDSLSLSSRALNLARLEICEPLSSQPHWQEDVDDSQWLELLWPFTTVKDLSLSKEFIPRIVPALLESASGSWLPELQNIFLPETPLSGPVNKALAQFVTTRRFFGRPVAVNPQVQE
jgi:hypothetical protein